MNIITYILAAILLFSGGFSWFFTKLHAGYSMPVEFSIFYRLIGASFFIFLSAVLAGKAKIFRLNKEEWKIVLKVTVFYYVFYFMGAYYGSKFLAAGIVAFIASTKTIFTELFLSIKEYKRPSSGILIAAVIGAIGIAMMSRSNMKISNLSLAEVLFGIGFAFIAPVSNSISYVVIKTSEAKKTLNNFALASYGAFIGSVIILLFAVIKYKTFIMMPLDIKYLTGWFYLAFGASGLITVIAYYLIEKIGPSKTTMMSLAHAPTALLLSVMFMNYQLDLLTIIGMTLCVVALYFGLKSKTGNK